MDDVRIGDRQDHAGAAGAQEPVDDGTQVDDVRRAVGTRLGVHAVVGGDAEHRAGTIEGVEVAVEHRVEVGRGRRARRVLVLDVVGERQVERVGSLAPEQLEPRGQHVLRELRAVDRRHGHRDEVGRAVDAVLGLRRLVRLLGREAHALHLVTEQAAELVLGRHDRRPRAGARERRQ